LGIAGRTIRNADEMEKKHSPSGLKCPACQNYFITWDPGKPYGCRALGFKSRTTPIRIVQRSTPGMNCQWYRPLERKRGTF
jgi:hypothetical protein